MKNKEKYALKEKEKEKAKEKKNIKNCMVTSVFYRRCGSYMM